MTEKRPLIYPFSLKRHYTPFATFGRYEVERKGEIYKHVYVDKVAHGQITQLGKVMFESIEKFEGNIPEGKRAYQVEIDFVYEVQDQEHIYTIRSVFCETFEEATDEVEFELDSKQQRFIISGIKRYLRADIKLNVIW